MQDSTAVERWLPIPCFEGSYDVSDLGRVRSVARVVQRRTSPQRWPERILSSPLDGDGRPCVGLRLNGKLYSRRVHSLVLLAFVGPRPPGMECCHRNGDRTDNRLLNLRWGTASSNSFDKVRHGTHLNTRKIKCPRKHLLKAPNLLAYKLDIGRRSCKSCDLARIETGSVKAPEFREAADRNYERIMSGVSRGVG
jgi:hypothetical protein